MQLGTERLILRPWQEFFDISLHTKCLMELVLEESISHGRHSVSDG